MNPEEQILYLALSIRRTPYCRSILLHAKRHLQRDIDITYRLFCATRGIKIKSPNNKV